MYFFRTKEMHETYEAYKAAGHLENGCVLCEREAAKEFKFWKIIPNKFPYDGVAEVHDMIVSKRHVDEADLTDEEKDELFEIKNTYIDEHYVFVLEALPRRKSIPPHFHLHLIVPKETL